MTIEKTPNLSEHPGPGLEKSVPSSTPPSGAQQGPGFAIQMLALAKRKVWMAQCSGGAHLGPSG